MPETLDIVHLRTLVAIADCGGFGRAAVALHISQPTVSQHVRTLERRLERTFIEKVGRKARFTPAGERLLAAYQAAPTPPDVVCVHNPRMAEPLRGTARLILCGHLHRVEVETKDGTVVCNAGTTGGAGVRMSGATSCPSSCSSSCPSCSSWPCSPPSAAPRGAAVRPTIVNVPLTGKATVG